jgi:hypothetical protein
MFVPDHLIGREIQKRYSENKNSTPVRQIPVRKNEAGLKAAEQVSEMQSI